MQRPPVIRTKKELKAKLDLLEALGDIEIAMKILNHKDSSENPIDTHYHDLKCDLKPIDKKCDTFKVHISSLNVLDRPKNWSSPLV